MRQIFDTTFESTSQKEKMEHCVGRLSGQLIQTLQPYFPRGAKVTLLGFPSHENIGDHAIWIATKHLFKRFGAKVIYETSIYSLDIQRLKTRITPETIIVLSGGGDFGDLWKKIQENREEVLRSFPNHTIIQLPQSIEYSNLSNLAACKDLVNAHKRFHLFVRDRFSFDFAKQHFQAPVILCPDMVFALGNQKRKNKPKISAVWLMRIDKEARSEFCISEEAQRHQDRLYADWKQCGNLSSFFQKIHWEMIHAFQDYPKRLAFLKDLLPLTFEPIAKRYLTLGCNFLSKGKVVVTDRLHGHILCLLMGIPHVCLDNSYHKIRNFQKTWTQNVQGIVYASSIEEAEKKSEELLAETDV
jgi:exopolysaccharide biosynthesis predicted pyruvyltransferase EpsI